MIGSKREKWKRKDKYRFTGASDVLGKRANWAFCFAVDILMKAKRERGGIRWSREKEGWGIQFGPNLSMKGLTLLTLK